LAAWSRRRRTVSLLLDVDAGADEEAIEQAVEQYLDMLEGPGLPPAMVDSYSARRGRASNNLTSGGTACCSNVPRSYKSKGFQA
jgi:hypothetical protein